MGVVYKARDPRIDRVVALKTVSLAGQRPEDEIEYRERFFREAQAAGRLSHPGIVTIFDVGEEAETHAPYIVMEFVNGPSLEKVLSGNDRTLPLETSLQLALELADALDCAHCQGVIHRDLKPANILITEEGRAKIADFGVAKLNLSNLTLGGRALGTPAFMSPEQLAGEEVDGRSDLFSLGVILYTMLTGYRPFQGNSAHTVSFKVVNREPIPATVLTTGLPAEIDSIIARAMAKDPARRYQRGMEIAAAVQELQERKAQQNQTTPTGSFAALDAERTTNAGTTRSRLTGGLAITPRRRVGHHPPHFGQDIAHKVMGRIGKAPVVTSAVFLIGLAVLGIGLSYPFGARKTASAMGGEAAAPKPLSPAMPAGEGASVVAQAAPVPAPDGPAPALPQHTAAKPARNTSATAKAPRLPAPQPLSKAPTLVANAAPMAPSAPTPVAPATLEIEVDHKFEQAHLSISVDNFPAYTHLLEGTSKQRLVVFHHVQGHEIHAMQIAPGRHLLLVRIQSEANSYDQSSAVVGEFVSGQESLLHINFGKHGEMQLNLQ